MQKQSYTRALPFPKFFSAYLSSVTKCANDNDKNVIEASLLFKW